MKNEPLCRRSPPNVAGAVHAACRAASAPRLCPMSTGRPIVATCSVSAGTRRERERAGVRRVGGVPLVAPRTRAHQGDAERRERSRGDHRPGVRREPAVGVHLRAVVAEEHRQRLVGRGCRPATRSRRRGGRRRSATASARPARRRRGRRPARPARGRRAAGSTSGRRTGPAVRRSLDGSGRRSPSTSRRYSRRSTGRSVSRTSQPPSTCVIEVSPSRRWAQTRTLDAACSGSAYRTTTSSPSTSVTRSGTRENLPKPWTYRQSLLSFVDSQRRTMNRKNPLARSRSSSRSSGA